MAKRSELRNVSTSLHFRLLCILRQQGWFYTEYGIELSRPDTDAPIFVVPELHHPFVYVDDQCNPWPSGVKVYANGVPLPTGLYVVDYRDSQIRFAVLPTGTITADVTHYSVSVKEGYPTDEELEQIQLPVISYQIETNNSDDFALGVGDKFRTRYCTIDVLATQEGERQDLTDNIHRFVAYVPYVEFSNHEPLAEDGQLDFAFSFADQYDGTLRFPSGIRGDLLKPRRGGSDKERFRSLITFEVERVS